ncbi:MAG: CoA transferase [Dehalococcoidia bacterium]
MPPALSGIKVLDLTGMGPASFAAMMLGDMGAEVIKISTPPGASERGVGQGIDFVEGEEPAFNMESLRNKRSMALNLKRDEGKRIFHQLAKNADVIIESYRPGVMDRLGIGYQSISDMNPGIIYCSVSGYGQESPYRNLPGHDCNYAAMGGTLSLIGYSDQEPPVLVQNTLADLTTAVLQAVIGILMAVIARQKTGRGQIVDISMADGVVFLLNTIPEVAEYLFKGVVPRRGETIFGGAQPSYAVYETADGKYLTIGALEPHFWRNLCRAVEREDLLNDWFAPSPRREEVFNELRGIFRSRSRDEWFEILSGADVPVGKVLEIDELFSEPHVLQREMLIELEHPRFGKMKQIGFPIKFSDTPWQVTSPASRLGEHTSEILSEMGYSQEEIEGLRSTRAIY